MRLITRKIYRAFPALDHFSDEQCEQFVRAARGGALGGGAIIAARIVLMIIVLSVVRVIANKALESAAVQSLLSMGFDSSISRGVIFVGACMLPAAGIAYLLSGDILLHLLLRRMFKRIGNCGQCRYSLTGLEVIDGCIVRCPECARENIVQGGADEVVPGTDGVLRYLPLATTPRLREMAHHPSRRHEGIVIAFAVMLPFLLCALLALILSFFAREYIS